MSSVVPKSRRETRQPRTSITDFTVQEQQVIAAVHRWFPGRLSVFGSRAKGNWAADSDLDIGVDGFRSVAHKNVRDYLSTFFGLRVDLRCYDSVSSRKETVVIYG